MPLKFKDAVRKLSDDPTLKLYFFFCEKGKDGKPVMLIDTKKLDPTKDGPAKDALATAKAKGNSTGTVRMREKVLSLKQKGPGLSASKLATGVKIAVHQEKAASLIQGVEVGEPEAEEAENKEVAVPEVAPASQVAGPSIADGGSRDKGKEKETEDRPANASWREKEKESEAPADVSEIESLRRLFKQLLPEARSCQHHPKAGAKVGSLIEEIQGHLERNETGPAKSKVNNLGKLVYKIPPEERIWHGVVDDEEAFSRPHDDKDVMNRLQQERAEARRREEHKTSEEGRKREQQIESVQEKLREQGLYNGETSSLLLLARERVARGEKPTRELQEVRILVEAARPERRPVEYRQRLEKIPVPEEGSVSDTALKQLKKQREEVLLLIERGSEDPEPLLIMLRRATADALDTFARREEFEKELDALTLPEGLSEDGLAMLTALRNNVVQCIDGGISPRSSLDDLRRGIEEVHAIRAREKEYLARLEKVPSPEGKTEPQAAELEELATGIAKAIKAGDNPEHLLTRLENRVREMESVNARRDELQTRLAAIPKAAAMPPGPHIARHKQMRVEIEEAIQKGMNPDELLAKLEEDVSGVAKVIAERQKLKRQLELVEDPPGLSARQAYELNELRTRVRAEIEQNIDPSSSLAELQGRVKEVGEVVVRVRNDRDRLKRIADEQGAWLTPLQQQKANAKQLARLLRLRREIEYILEADGDAGRLLDRLENEVSNFREINDIRRKWAEELKAIPEPSGLPEDELVAWEDLREQTKIFIDEGIDPSSSLKQLRKLAGVK